MKINIADIAKMAGVSKATVSRVINNQKNGVGQETREKVQKIIDAEGYRPNALARSVATSRSMTIGIVVPDISNPFFPNLVRGISDYAMEKGYTVFLCNSDNNSRSERGLLRAFEEKRVDGILLVSGNDSKKNEELVGSLAIPVVYLDRVSPAVSGSGSISINNFNGGYLAGQQLCKNGAKQIAFLGGHKELFNVSERFFGFSAALQEKGRAVDNSLVLYDEFSIEGGYRMAQQLLEKGDCPEGIFATCDLIAIGVLRALKEKGIAVPQQVELVGFDDIEYVKICDPQITTVAQPAYEMATEATRLLIAVIEHESFSVRHMVVEPQLIIRGTTR